MVDVARAVSFYGVSSIVFNMLDIFDFISWNYRVFMKCVKNMHYEGENNSIVYTRDHIISFHHRSHSVKRLDISFLKRWKRCATKRKTVTREQEMNEMFRRGFIGEQWKSIPVANCRVYAQNVFELLLFEALKPNKFNFYYLCQFIYV